MNTILSQLCPFLKATLTAERPKCRNVNSSFTTDTQSQWLNLMAEHTSSLHTSVPQSPLMYICKLLQHSYHLKRTWNTGHEDGMKSHYTCHKLNTLLSTLMALRVYSDPTFKRQKWCQDVSRCEEWGKSTNMTFGWREEQNEPQLTAHPNKIL